MDKKSLERHEAAERIYKIFDIKEEMMEEIKNQLRPYAPEEHRVIISYVFLLVVRDLLGALSLAALSVQGEGDG